MMTLKSTNGIDFYIDEMDFEAVSFYGWHASPHGRTMRLKRSNCITRNGEWMTKKTAFLHRYILKLEKGMIVDHIDGNALNNCRSNLRVCTHADNARNAPSRKGGTSNFLGVCWCPEQSKWMVQVHIDGKYKKVGRYEDEKEAALAYNVAASFSYGQFARLNKI